ncbi:flavin-containing monooxygenase [Nocardioides sp.]|uniref:flavin-containing monooxygenase n=1 Tax=Nocardioides sp. TaxID=35761 RepID=UPI003D11C8FC
MAIPDELHDPAFLGFRPEEIVAKYRAERDKRVRTEGERQYVSVDTSGSLSGYLTDDPYSEVQDRAPLDEESECVVIGAGWAGMTSAVRLLESGVESLRIIDAGGGFGGTWYWNRYPGCACDVPSYLYLPLLEEMGYMPEERFSSATEIYAYANLIAERYELADRTVFHTWVSDLRWDEGDSRWQVTTNRGDTIRARFVVLGTGPASRPRLPGIPGIEDFEGVSFHSSRWDYGYTGGGPDGGLDGLADKRVAIIGTGATGVQIVPHLARSAKQVYVVQRTPSPILWRDNRKTDPDWFAEVSREPGWQARLWGSFNAAIDGGNPDPGVLDERGMAIIAFQLKHLKDKVDLDPSQLTPEEWGRLYELADHAAMEAVRSRVDLAVRDETKAEALKPWYRLFCKRPTPSDDYLQAFDQDNVALLDVSGSKGLDRITRTGIVANGVEYDVDCIVYASGFEITSSYEKRIGIPVTGQDGQSIYDHWSDGMRSMYQLMYAGFPNLFTVGGLFGLTLSLNYCTSIEDQARMIVRVVGELDARSAASAQPTREAEDAWRHLQVTLPPAGPYASLFGGSAESCTPGYYNQEGIEVSARRDYRLDSFPLGANGYAALVHTWQEADELEGLELRTSGTPTAGTP